MVDPHHRELRQIKRILAAILGCLLILVVAVAPPIVAFLAVVALVGAAVLAFSNTARDWAAAWWGELASHWRS